MSRLSIHTVSAHRTDAAARGLARVLEARAGEALRVRLEGRDLPVRVHLDDVPALEAGDQVLVELLGEGVAVVGRCRQPGELPAGRISQDADGALHIEAVAGIVLRVRDSRIELRADGAVVIDGRTVYTLAQGVNRIQGATVEIN